MHYPTFIIVLSCLALSSCSAPEGSEPVRIADTRQLKASIGTRCSVEGVAVNPPKGFMVVQSSTDTWLVSLQGMGSWPRSVLGKKVRATGVASELTQPVNDKGEPVDEQGRLVQASAEPVLYLRDCTFVVLGE